MQVLHVLPSGLIIKKKYTQSDILEPQLCLFDLRRQQNNMPDLFYVIIKNYQTGYFKD